VLALGGPILTQHGRVPTTDPAGFEVAQLHLAQGRQDQVLEELVVLLSRARRQVTLGYTAAREPVQEVELGALLALLLRRTPRAALDRPMGSGQPGLGVEADREGMRGVVPDPVGTPVAGPQSARPKLDRAERPGPCGHVSHLQRVLLVP